jgi:REP element-mobilizing transposase RayT
MDTGRFNGLPSTPMSAHSYSRCWLHLIWGTLNREKLLNKEAAARLSRYLTEYADTKGVYMKINYVNADHVHALVDLPTGVSVEELIQLLKGSSSHWINANNILPGNLPGEEATGPFRCRNPTSHRLALT